MSLSDDAAWPESLRPLYAEVMQAPPVEVVSSAARWRDVFAQWVKGASLEERTRAQAAAWERLDSGERAPGELLFLLSTCSELLWPYAEAPKGLLRRLLERQGMAVEALRGAGEEEGAARVKRDTDVALSTVLTRYLKRHPDSLLAMVDGVTCVFDGRALRFQDAVEVDLKQVLGAGPKSLDVFEQLRALLPDTREEGRDKLADFIRTRVGRMPWREASDALAERLFSLAVSPEGRSGLRGFLACYPNGRMDPDWCSRAGVLLARTVETGGPQPVVENLCELLALFDVPPVDGLRGALGALVQSDFEGSADLGHVRFVLDHCRATLRKKEPGLVLALLWLEERLFRAAVRRGAADAFERRGKARSKLEAATPGFAQLSWLAEECAELWPRFAEGGTRPGLDELAAWRHEMAERIGRKPVLRKAALEFFLWCAPDAASSEAELAVLALVRTATDRRLVRRLKDHPSSRVRFRVRVLQSWLQAGGGPAPRSSSKGASEGTEAPAARVEPASVPATLTEALRHLHATRSVQVGGRTWLRDRDLEELLVGAVARVEADFTSRYAERFRENLSEQVAGVLEGMRRELERVRADVSMLLAQGSAAPLELGFTVRRNEKPPEERPTGVEVAFLLSVEAPGFVETRRVSLVHVTKLEQRGDGQWAPSFPLGRERLDALLARTEAAFCLFLGPAFVRAECAVLPSRVTRGLMETQRSLTAVSRESVQRPARSLAHWWVSDFLGLWTGDERAPVLEDALGGGERAPDFVVQVSLRGT